MHQNVQLSGDAKYTNLQGFNANQYSNNNSTISNVNIPKNLDLIEGGSANVSQNNYSSPNQRPPQGKNDFMSDNFGGEFSSGGNQNFKWNGFKDDDNFANFGNMQNQQNTNTFGERGAITNNQFGALQQQSIGSPFINQSQKDIGE